jgi:hypothetical protein
MPGTEHEDLVLRGVSSAVMGGPVADWPAGRLCVLPVRY